MIIIYVYDISTNEYRKITYGEVKRALESDISYQGVNGYGTGSPGAYQNLPSGVVEPMPEDGDQVTFNCHWTPFVMNGLSQLGIKAKIIESGQEGFPEVIDPVKVLLRELTIDPLTRGYASMSAQEKMDSLNTKNRAVLTEKFITARTLLAELDLAVAASIYAKLKAVSDANPVMGIAWDMLTTYSDGGGIDICHANTQIFIDTLVGGGVLTSDEGTAVKQLAFMSRAKELIGRNVVLTDVE